MNNSWLPRTIEEIHSLHEFAGFYPFLGSHIGRIGYICEDKIFRFDLYSKDKIGLRGYSNNENLDVIITLREYLIPIILYHVKNENEFYMEVPQYTKDKFYMNENEYKVIKSFWFSVAFKEK